MRSRSVNASRSLSLCLSGADFSFSPTFRSRSNGGETKGERREKGSEEERERGLSYQFLLPSINFNGDVSEGKRREREREREEGRKNGLDMCENEMRR